MISTLRRLFRDEPPTPTPVDWLDEEELFDIIGTERRRLAVIALAEHGRPMELRDLAVTVAARQKETTPEDVSTTDRKNTYVTLLQNHLPKLDRYDLVDIDGQNVVTPVQGIETVAAYAQEGETLVGGDE